MVRSKAVFNDFLKCTETGSANICRLSEGLGKDDCIVCFIQNGLVTYSTSVENERYETVYRLKDGKVFRSHTETVIEQETAL